MNCTVYVYILVSSPTVKNVFIPGVVSPTAPPPRRNRRRHRLRVPCSECHCPQNNTTKSKTSQKHSQTLDLPHNRFPPHPLVRSKSAVVRSLYKKMKTPFTRSRTVDENLLRYYSPETSEYSVAPAYMLRPENLGSNIRRRIPEIYVEDCLKVDFNNKIVDRFRTEPFYHRASTLSAGKTEMFPATRLALRNAMPDWTRRLSRFNSIPRTKSCEYESISDDWLGSRRFLPQRAKSFEYESLPQSIFSDDSLRTARRKLKRNLSMNDSGYDDSIEIIQDQSKPYYDVTAENKSYPTQNLNSYYGYDSELSGAETEINLSSSFERQSLDSVVGTGLYNHTRFFGTEDLPDPPKLPGLDSLLFQTSARDDVGKRKYRESDYCEVPFGTSLQRTPEKRPKASDYPDQRRQSRLSRDPSREHIYCSIDDELAPEDSRRERPETDRRRARTKSNDSYLDYDRSDRCQICNNRNERWDDQFYVGSSDYDVHGDHYPEVRSEEFDVEVAFGNSRNDEEEYRFQNYHDDRGPRRHSGGSSATAQRARSIYETRRQSLSVPSLRESKRLTARAESSPQLNSDDDFGSSETIVHLGQSGQYEGPGGRGTNRKSNERRLGRRDDDGNRGSRSTPDFCYSDDEEFGSRDTVVAHSSAQRRRRNSSCPEARDIRLLERSEPQGKRNVAISDTLEYYEYSMESESQCSETCGFGPSDPRRGSPRVVAPSAKTSAPNPTPPSIANSIVFDSLSANSDTAKNSRAANETISSGKQQLQQSSASGSNNPADADADIDIETTPSSRRSRVSSNPDGHDTNRRSSSMPESREYTNQSNPYEGSSRHEMTGNRHSVKRGQFTRSLSNADVPPDEKAGESLILA